jgi:hypothetical protein
LYRLIKIEEELENDHQNQSTDKITCKVKKICKEESLWEWSQKPRKSQSD